MKFKIGSSVEALRRNYDPCGYWFPGTIISADKDSYRIEYKFLMDYNGEPVIDKVHKDDVRPQPLNKVKKWRIGDIIEVFDARCWRVAEVAKMSREKLFVVRMYGGSRRLREIHETDMRIRQAWLDNKWSIIGKVTQGKQHSLQVARDKQHFQQKNSKYSLNVLSKTREDTNKDYPVSKKSPSVRTRKRKANPLSMPIRGKFSPKIRKHETVIEGSFELEAKRVKATTASEESHWSSEESDQCSVASCSSVDFAYCSRKNSQKSREDISNGSDAESSFPLGPMRKELDVNVHDLELQAYESTVQALYASGPLSWEQESLLTNLRLLLNISDEEHLLQLRHLLSSQVV